MVTLRPWQPEDRPLLDRFNTPEMTAHLGASESDDELDRRHERYLQRDRPGGMLVICDGATPVGSIGYWESTEDDGTVVWEMGWSVLPEHQGRGYAGRALTELNTMVRADGRHAELHAYPSVENVPSNALCRRGGFTLRREITESFRGVEMRFNVWALVL